MAFKSTNYMFLSKIYGPASGGADLVAYNYFTRLQTGVTYEYSYTRNWIAIGQQQWGSLSNWSTGANSYTYPIAFSERTYSLAYSITTVRESAVAIYNATKTEFTYSTNAASTSVGISVIFLGKQQWGYYFESQSDTDYRYLPLTYTTHYCIALGNITYAPNELEGGFVPYYQEVSNSVFLVGLGNNRIGNAYVPVITVGI